jgi:hypothetical protein
MTSTPRRGLLRLERQGVSSLVFKGVHLLGHDIGRLADPTLKQPGVFQRGRGDSAVTGSPKGLLGYPVELLDIAPLITKDVPRPPGALDRLDHELLLVSHT